MAAILHPHLVHPIVQQTFECNSSSCSSSRADMCSPPGASSLSSCGPSPLRLTLDHDDSDSDEVLSVGSEETPPLTSPQNNDPPRSGLKFSIDNILKPEFGRPNEDLVCDNNTDVVIRQNKTVKSSSNNKKSQSPTSQPINLSAKDGTSSASSTDGVSSQPLLWPAWVYCTRYSDRPSSGRSPRSRKIKRKERPPEEKRPRTAFTSEQLARLKQEFQENRYLTERRRQQLASELKLNESQIKIWFQNKRAKIKKSTGQKNPLALQLMAQGLYNHSTIHSSADSGDDEDSTKD